MKVTVGTNRNAINMEQLAEATMVAGSQAAQSGVEIDQLTAAVGTMAVVTQQGGDIAGRAYKALLMNIQNVKGTTEDGEIIDAEALSKSEKAADAMGVKLKEVKNGILSLRDPMQILEELSQAFNKLDETDVRRSNLIAALGGKYRGNQVAALLGNWDTYEKLLSDYSNSYGSAMKEAQKTANSWEGRLNKLTNTWNSFVANMINSDWIKGGISTITLLVSTFDSLSKILLVVGGVFLALKLPVLITGFTTFGTIIKNIAFSFTYATTTGTSLKAALTGMGVAAQFTQLAIGGITIALTAGLMYWQYSTQKAEEYKQKQLELAKAAKEENNTLNDLINKYKELASLDTDDTSSREQIKNIQSQITDLVGKQANNLDLVNGKLDNQLNKLLAIQSEEARKNYGTLVSQYGASKNDFNNPVGQQSFFGMRGFEYTGANDYKARDLLKDIPNLSYNKDFDFNTFTDVASWFSDFVTVSGNAQERLDAVNEAISRLESSANYDIVDSKLYQGLVSSRKYYSDIIDQLNEYTDALNVNIVKQNTTSTAVVNSENDFIQYRKAIIDATLADKGHAGTLKDVERVVDTLIGKQFPQYAQTLTTNLQSQSQATQQLTFDTESYLKSLSDFESSIKDIGSLYDTLNKGEEVSADLLLRLIAQYPEYAVQIANANKNKENGIKLAKLLFEAEKKTILMDLTSKRDAIKIDYDKAKSTLFLINLQYKYFQVMVASVTATDALRATAQRLADAVNKANQDFNTNKQNLDTYNAAIDTLSNSTLSDFTSQTKQSTSAVKDQADALKEQQQILSDAQSAINDLVQIRIELIKAEKEAEKDALNATLKAEKEKLDAKQKNIDKQKEALDQLKQERDNQNELADKQKAISKVQTELISLAKDNSPEAIKRKLELQNELTKAQTDLSDYQFDQSIQKQQEALDKESEKNQQSYDNFKQSIDDKLEAIDDYLSQSGTLFNDALKDLSKMNSSMYQEMVNWNKKYGDGITLNIKNKWDEATKAIKEYSKSLDAVSAYNGITSKIYNIPLSDVGKSVPTSGSTSNGSKTTTTTNPLTKGKIVKVSDSATHYSANLGKNKRMPDSVSGGSYTVIQIEGNEILIGKNGVPTGWVNKSDLKWHSGANKGLIGGVYGSSEAQNFLRLLSDETPIIGKFGESIINEAQMKRFMNFTLPALKSSVFNNNTPIQIKHDINIYGKADENTVKELRKFQRETINMTMNEINRKYRNSGGSRNAKDLD